jgi:GNAT superfamily N-acetyltransferase
VTRKFLAQVRVLGLWNFLLYACDRTLSACSRGGIRVYRYYLQAQPIPGRALLPPARGKSITVTHYGPADLERAQNLRPLDVVRSRAAQQSECFVATREGAFAGFLWLAPGVYDEDEVRCRFVALPRGATVWDYDIYVDPAHRGGPAFVRLWDAANEVLRGRGVRWTLSRISAFNPGSSSAHDRLGSRRIGSAAFLVAGSRQLMIATVRPYLHLSMSDASRPILLLDAE